VFNNGTYILKDLFEFVHALERN